MISVGFFSEYKLYNDNGKIEEYMQEKIDYDKDVVITYLKQCKVIASCPKLILNRVCKGQKSEEDLIEIYKFLHVMGFTLEWT